MSASSSERTFRSAVDGWFWLLALALPAAIIAWVAVVVLNEGGGSAVVLTLLAVTALSLGLPLWILVDTRYTVADGELRIRSGPVRTTIALDDIRSATPSRSLLAGPALSLDRLEIRYGRHGSVLVSPQERDVFLAAIGQAAKDKPPAQAAS